MGGWLKYVDGIGWSCFVIYWKDLGVIGHCGLLFTDLREMPTADQVNINSCLQQFQLTEHSTSEGFKSN